MEGAGEHDQHIKVAVGFGFSARLGAEEDYMAEAVAVKLMQALPRFLKVRIHGCMAWRGQRDGLYTVRRLLVSLQAEGMGFAPGGGNKAVKRRHPPSP